MRSNSGLAAVGGAWVRAQRRASVSRDTKIHRTYMQVSAVINRDTRRSAIDWFRRRGRELCSGGVSVGQMIALCHLPAGQSRAGGELRSPGTGQEARPHLLLLLQFAVGDFADGGKIER